MPEDIGGSAFRYFPESRALRLCIGRGASELIGRQLLLAGYLRSATNFMNIR